MAKSNLPCAAIASAACMIAGNVITPDRFDTVTAKMINAYPLPLTSGLTNNYTTNLNQIQNWDQGDVRVDHQITSNDQFFARFADFAVK